MEKPTLSLLVLTRNSEETVTDNLTKIKEYLDTLKIISEHEIIVSDYSEDNTLTKVKSLSNKFNKIKFLKAPRRGIGCGLVTGAKLAQYDILLFYPIDMSWNIDVIEKSIMKIEDGYDVVIGSRGLSDSIVTRPFKRKIFSLFYNSLVNLLFGLHIGDTQGTIAFRKKDFHSYQENLISDGAFLQTEILIHSKEKNLKILEIPCIVKDVRKDSTVKINQYVIQMFKDALRKRFH